MWRRKQLKEPVSSPNGVPLETWKSWTVSQRYDWIEGRRGAVVDDTTTYAFKPIGAWPAGLVGPSFAAGRLGAEKLVVAYAKRHRYQVQSVGELEWELNDGTRSGRLAAYALGGK
ncbi:hypothetical protein [Mycobacteroides abscessus]|uniref:hypothetical protein n=1 Tax=Mycobacteroides abscessus TaxID=36809 RepID=UPI001928EFFB|nr:hypothetical protein [Mycobacteroides abscessus]MBL3753010.1 hypothetical protein [Mycobacteroides abscessus subsp. massiliense]